MAPRADGPQRSNRFSAKMWDRFGAGSGSILDFSEWTFLAPSMAQCHTLKMAYKISPRSPANREAYPEVFQHARKAAANALAWVERCYTNTRVHFDDGTSIEGEIDIRQWADRQGVR